MNTRLLTRKTEDAAHPEGGFTLLEMVIAVVLLTMIIGAISAAFVSSLNATAATKTRVTETNDAQLIGAFFTRDAQAAGGSNPATGTADTSAPDVLGVSKTDNASCAVPGQQLIVRFKWIDLSSNTVHVANYSYVSATTTVGGVTYQPKQLVRTICVGTSPNQTVGSSVLASNVVVTAAPNASPVAWCDGNQNPPTCPALFPNTVSMRITEDNTVQQAPAPYTFTLTASLRPQANAQPDTTAAAAISPLVLLGRGGCGPGIEHTSGLGVEFTGNFGSSTTVNLHVFGKAFINTADFSPSCPAMNLALNAGQVYQADGGTNVLQGGHCNPTWSQTPCPTLTSYSPALGNPYAALDSIPPTVPPVSTALNLPTISNGNCNGNISPGIYTSTLTVGLAATCTLAPGVYILNAGLNVSPGIFGFFPGLLQSATSGLNPGVLLYIAGGQVNAGGNINITGLSPNYSTATKPYAGLAIWQAKSDTNVVQFGPSILGSSTILGNIYAPSAEVVNSFTAATTLNIGGIVATSLVVEATASFGGNGGMNLGKLPPINVVAQTLPNATQGQPYTATIAATGGDGAYIFTAPGLPAGLIINSTTGVITGTPTASGTVSFNVTANDTANDPPDTKQFTLTTISAPTFASIAPNTGARGSSQTVTITGTNFVAGPTVAFSGTGVTMSNPVVGNGGTTITGTVTVTVNAALSARNVTVTNTDGGTVTAAGAFTVTAAPTATITAINPASFDRGTTKTVTITGTNLIAGAVASFAPNTGVTLSNQTVVNATTMTVQVALAGNAALSARNVTVTNGDGNAATGTLVFTVLSLPTITNVQLVNHAGGTAGKIEQGDTIVVTFSTQMNANTFCATWPDGTADRTLTNSSNVVTVHSNGNNDTISSVVAGGCTFHFGTINLNGNYISNSDATFGSAAGNTTYTWTAASNTLTITLGAKGNNGTMNTVNSSSPTYNADAAIADPQGGTLNNSPFTVPTGKQF